MNLLKKNDSLKNEKCIKKLTLKRPIIISNKINLEVKNKKKHLSIKNFKRKD